MSEFHFDCGDVHSTLRGARHLSTQGSYQNINLDVADISTAMLANLPPLLLDLLEVAAYIFCADQQSPRGSHTLPDYGDGWRRQMYFTIPVREIEVWKQPEVSQALADVLTFLSDDFYSFTFTKAVQPATERHLYFHDQVERAWSPDRVMLFSGGLDSLAGAAEALSIGQRVALVGHHSSSKVFHIQKELVKRLQETRVCRQPLLRTRTSHQQRARGGREHATDTLIPVCVAGLGDSPDVWPLGADLL